MALWLVVLVALCLNANDLAAQNCGTAPLNTKIVGGTDAIAGSWPWQVSMHLGGFHICGGTLISSQWALTAAHCILSRKASDWTLYLGRQTQLSSNPNEVSSSVSQVIVHPQFNNTLLNNDLALMGLSSGISFTAYIRPICLADSSSLFFTSTSCWVTGWGRISNGVSLGAPQTLQEVNVPVVGNQQCTCQYRPAEDAIITNQMICAGQKNKGACQGDSGGPLQCKQGSVWIQAGISSYGVPCALGTFPEVYARVSQFQTWITNNVAGATVEFVTYSSNGTNTDNSFVCSNTSSTAVPSFTPSATSRAQLKLVLTLLTMLSILCL